MKKLLAVLLIALVQFVPLSSFAALKSVAGYGGVLAINSQSAAYGFVMSDVGKIVLHPTADTTARTFTIPANSATPFPVGAMITIVNEYNAGVVTLAITTDTLYWAGNPSSTGSRTLTAYCVATIVKITSTEWVISGVGIT